MAAMMTNSVSKWLQRPAFALICLITMQAVVSLSGCHPEQLPMAARIAAFR